MLTTSETLSADAGCVPCGRTPKRKPAEGGEELLKRNDLTVGNDLWIRRLLSALFLTAWNFATSLVVKEHSSGRCPWVCNHQPAVYLIIYKVCQRCDIHTAWASALLVLTTWAMRRPQAVGRVAVRVPRFFRKYTKKTHDSNHRIRDRLASV